MKPILEIQGVSKKFRIDAARKSYLTLRERIAHSFRKSATTPTDFWALRDVSFTVNAGESVGIIGKNGAGKSTLLKILSKITPPTEGRIVGRGRIASLLEVGTGFHQELTGRENVYLNGSILGMKKREIDSRFDEIIDFAGTEKFLDTALKHYSSGMQMRLAFAVAAFLDPEILVIDEVLAVGDAEFQKKCLGKMEDVSRSGRTILFVSHNIQAVVNLCKSAILLRDGRIISSGNSREVAAAYEGILKSDAPVYVRDESKSTIFFKKVRLMAKDGSDRNVFAWQDNVGIQLVIVSRISSTPVRITVGIMSLTGTKVFFTESDAKFSSGDNIFEVMIPGSSLAPGRFSLFLELHVPNTMAFDHQEQVCPFLIEETGSPYSIYNGGWDCGVMVVPCQWVRR